VEVTSKAACSGSRSNQALTHCMASFSTSECSMAGIAPSLSHGIRPVRSKSECHTSSLEQVTYLFFFNLPLVHIHTAYSCVADLDPNFSVLLDEPSRVGCERLEWESQQTLTVLPYYRWCCCGGFCGFSASTGVRQTQVKNYFCLLMWHFN
jgi:hypothetical protein